MWHSTVDTLSNLWICSWTTYKLVNRVIASVQIRPNWAERMGAVWWSLERARGWEESVEVHLGGWERWVEISRNGTTLKFTYEQYYSNHRIAHLFDRYGFRTTIRGSLFLYCTETFSPKGVEGKFYWEEVLLWLNPCKGLQPNLHSLSGTIRNQQRKSI